MLRTLAWSHGASAPTKGYCFRTLAYDCLPYPCTCRSEDLSPRG